MILCPSCNARNANRSTFCIRCGGALSTPAERDPGSHTDAFNILPEHTPAGLIDLAATELAEGRTQAAIENCRRAIALSPGEVEAHAILGMAYEQQGELPAALEAYEAVAALAPERNAERQKAALLRLRMGEHLTPVPQAARPAGPIVPQVYLERLKALIATNPPLWAGIASGIVIFVLGAVLLVSANRSQTARQVAAQYTQEVQLADQALVNEQYVEASAHYAAAWRLKQDDPTVLAHWKQAYDAAGQQQQASQTAQMPKYIPNLTGRNPFAPVPIGGTEAPPPIVPNPALPPPTASPVGAVAERPPMAYETVREPARQLPQTQGTPQTSRRPLPSPFGNQPISPVPEKNSNKPAVPAAPAPADATPKGPKGEVTIWVSDKPAPRPSAPAAVSNNADSLRSKGESAATDGRTSEAIQLLEQAASSYDDRARQDPSSASLSSRAAKTCRDRAAVLRKGQ